MSSKAILVADEPALAAVNAAIAAAPIVAIDTEFVRERTYFAQLCLIQIGTHTTAACVDCIARVDLRPLLATLLAPARTWVLHSARQDLEVIWNLAQALPARIIDTQVAAALLGFPPQVGLQGLLAELLGIALDKGHTRTDWSRRPLPDGALRYALDDVRFLLPAWQELRARLAALGRLEWLEEDCRRLAAEHPTADVATIFRRLKGITGLTRREQCAALALIEWRELRARTTDRPRRWILTDEQVLQICRALPATLPALGAIAELPRGVVTRSGEDILGALADSAAPERRSAVEAMLVEHKPDKAVVAAWRAAVQRCAAALDIHTEVLATRGDINALAAGADPRAVLSSWRVAELARAGAPVSAVGAPQ